MKIKIKIDGKDKEIELRPPKVYEIDGLWDILRKLKKANSGESVLEIMNLKEKIRQIALNCSSITEEEFKNLELPESEKITGEIGYYAFGDMDFSRLFKKRPKLEPTPQEAQK